MSIGINLLTNLLTYIQYLFTTCLIDTYILIYTCTIYLTLILPPPIYTLYTIYVSILSIYSLYIYLSPSLTLHIIPFPIPRAYRIWV